MHQYSVNADKFIEFLIELRRKYAKDRVIHVFLDNLSVHRSRKVKEYTETSNVRLVFNAAYSSEFNPIERFWALSKRIFQNKLNQETDLS
jgi:transposase